MSDLTATEKEQMAVLLGWSRYEEGWSNIDGSWFGYEFAPPFNLEACMKYAKGKGWGFDLTYWAYDKQYVAEICSDDWAVEDIGTAIEFDPLTAFVRALLKAEAAS